MARWLAAAGHDVALQDLDPARVAALADEIERAHPATQDDRARAEVVITMLPTSAVVEAALEAGGLVEALSPGTLVIDMSSAEPARSRALAARLRVRGLRYLDAPVSGGVRGAEAGTLAIMAGGDAADIEEAMPLLQAMGGGVVHVGEHGAGHAAKALNNLVSAASVVATVEALRAAESFGIEPARFVEVLNRSSGRSVTSEQKAERFMLSGRFDSGFPIGLMSKDVSIAVETAAQLGTEIELGAHVARIWESAAAGSGAEDHTRMYELLGRADAETAEGER
jgi:3-hydroxyisobutyrate dehydrogenase